MVKLSVAIL